MRGVTLRLSYYITTLQFQSTHPMRGVTSRQDGDAAPGRVSIHTPHAGCDIGVRH